MTDRVESGPLFGRPHGGVITLVRNDLINTVECVRISKQFVIIKVYKLLIINLYKCKKLSFYNNV